MLYRVIATEKGTEKTIVLSSGITEEKALKFCESWGWSYDDGYKSYWLGYEEIIFICQLPKSEQLKYYKRIKAFLISEGCFILENLENALNSKIKDLQGLI